MKNSKDFKYYWSHLGNFIESYGPTICLVIAGIGFAGLQYVSNGFSSNKESIIFLFICIIYGIGSFISDSRSRHYATAKNRIDELEGLIKHSKENIFRIWDIKLSGIANDLEFGDSERISIYKHEDDKFVMLGRYSINPDFNTSG